MKKGGRNSLGSPSVPVSGFDSIMWMPLPLVALMEQHLEVAGDGFETHQSMQEAFSYMVDGADAGEGRSECTVMA